jgi:hypothetical protein
MATNLRLRPEAEAALRAESAKTGRSQQELIRMAVDEFLGLATPRAATLNELIAAGVVTAPRPLRDDVQPIVLPSGVNSLDLLDRDDRF